MAIDFAADLAVMYSVDVFARTVRFVHAATGGPSLELPVIFDAPDEIAGIGNLGIDGRKRNCRAQAASFSIAPKRGDQLIVGEEILEVKTARQSPDALEWLLDLAPVRP